MHTILDISGSNHVLFICISGDHEVLTKFHDNTRMFSTTLARRGPLDCGYSTVCFGPSFQKHAGVPVVFWQAAMIEHRVRRMR